MKKENLICTYCRHEIEARSLYICPYTKRMRKLKRRKKYMCEVCIREMFGGGRVAAQQFMETTVEVKLDREPVFSAFP